MTVNLKSNLYIGPVNIFDTVIIHPCCKFNGCLAKTDFEVRRSMDTHITQKLLGVINCPCLSGVPLWWQEAILIATSGKTYLIDTHVPLRWRHNGRDGVSNHQPHDFTQPFIRAQIKVNIKAPRHGPLCGEVTGDLWIPRTNGQLRGKCFHLMTSSCFQSIILMTRW